MSDWIFSVPSSRTVGGENWKILLSQRKLCFAKTEFANLSLFCFLNYTVLLAESHVMGIIMLTGRSTFLILKQEKTNKPW